MQIVLKMRGFLLGVLLIPGALCGQSTPWEAIGPEGGPIGALAQDPSNPSVLLVASKSYPSTIFRSTDHGQTWASYSTYYGNVTKLIFDPVTPSVVYASRGYGLGRSTNAGQTWTDISFPANHNGMDFLLDPSDHNLIHVTGYVWDSGSGKWRPGYWKKTVNGSTWTEQYLGTSSGYLQAIEVEAGNPQNVYVGGYIDSAGYYPAKVYRSTDGGTSFADVTGAIEGYVYGIAADPLNPGRVYAVTYAGVYRSTNRGAYWTRNNGYLPSPASVRLVGNSIYVGTSSGVYKGSNGLDYSLLAGSEHPAGHQALHVEASTPHTIFFASYASLVRSTDGGATWASCTCGLSCGRITALCFAPSNPAILLAAREQDAVYKASSAIGSPVLWERLPEFYACTKIDEIVISPTDPNVIYAMEGGG